jgi:hypothetical protein
VLICIIGKTAVVLYVPSSVQVAIKLHVLLASMVITTRTIPASLATAHAHYAPISWAAQIVTSGSIFSITPVKTVVCFVESASIIILAITASIITF